MALKLCGVTLTADSKLSVKSITSITKIAGIPTSSIPGWPSSGPTCTTIYLGYADGRRQPPNAACSPPFAPYDYDSASGVIYIAGGCGDPSFIPDAGYYSDGGAIFDVTNGDGVLTFWGPCAR